MRFLAEKKSNSFPPGRNKAWRYFPGCGFFRLAALALVAAVLLAAHGAPMAMAQASFAGDPMDMSGMDGEGAGFASQPMSFTQDSRVKLLSLALSPYEVTESVAEQIGLILEQNLTNTGHFSVIGFRQANTQFENQNPDLVDCRQIACGVESGKRLAASRVMVGSIRQVEDEMVLKVRVVNVANNQTVFSDEVHFTDDNMDDQLFRLANEISANTLIIGRVLNTSIRGIVIDMGEKHGIKIGDFLVVYKSDTPVANNQGEVIDFQKKNIAIVKVLRVNSNSSEAILIHSVEEPQANHFVQTYLNPARQTVLLEDTRRELDTGIRMDNRLKPLELAPVMLADSDKKRWRHDMANAQSDAGYWLYATVGGGAASLLAFNLYKGDTQSQLMLGGALAFTGWSFWKMLGADDRVNTLHEEGRAKGFLGLAPLPDHGLMVSYQFRF